MSVLSTQYSVEFELVYDMFYINSVLTDNFVDFTSSSANITWLIVKLVCCVFGEHTRSHDRITHILWIVAKIPRNFGENIYENAPFASFFFKNFLREIFNPHLLREDKKLPLGLYMILYR